MRVTLRERVLVSALYAKARACELTRNPDGERWRSHARFVRQLAEPQAVTAAELDEALLSAWLRLISRTAQHYALTRQSRAELTCAFLVLSRAQRLWERLPRHEQRALPIVARPSA